MLSSTSAADTCIPSGARDLPEDLALLASISKLVKSFYLIYTVFIIIVENIIREGDLPKL